MAAKPQKNLFGGAGRNALDLPVAGLSALAAAFGAFALPQDILARAVVATGLPSILPAAQPPLGLTARVAVAVAGAAIVFGLVFLLLRLFDRSGMGAPETDAELPAAPRVRRRDGHPDAPAPRPISAARDLGEPAPPRVPRPPVPLWLDEAEPVAAPADVLELDMDAEFVGTPEPEPEPAPRQRPEPAAVVLPEPEPVAAPEPEASVAPASEPVSAPAHRPAPDAEMPTTIAGLMERLEQGLARRRMIDTPSEAPAAPAEPPQVFPEAPVAAPEPVAAEPLQAVPQAREAAPQVFPEPTPAEDRLQSAIASLQRLAARAS